MRTDYRYLERLARGVGNHRRIQILELLQTGGELDVISIARRLNINMKTASEHARRLFLAGHVHKRNKGASVLHSVTPQGAAFLDFLLSFAEPQRSRSKG